MQIEDKNTIFVDASYTPLSPTHNDATSLSYVSNSANKSFVPSAVHLALASIVTINNKDTNNPHSSNSNHSIVHIKSSMLLLATLVLVEPPLLFLLEQYKHQMNKMINKGL